ncbi:DNA polymerase III subunit chi [Alphaproteobacteria bacterium KMM 3653]|uniref:DNA polymerase III subunit chi n=1 Tax=Harenicola maris TaxID=2841044 RepID=A0AAP2CLB3_9RHOB|nr:DNA polymerase III subunit chi [Harenicola maris]
MGKVMFYHLTRRRAEAVLPPLLDRSLAQGWRVLLRGPNADRMARLDQSLWVSGGDESFLPHGLAGGPRDALQPILLSDNNDLPGDVSCLMVLDGAALTATEAQGLARTCVMFDDADDSAKSTARGQWKALLEAGLEAEYWSEETGNWQLKLRSGGEAS